MKTKTLLIFLVIVVLSGIANGSLHANENANVAIKNIEYLTGDDFVQLHFKIGQMIPIPDVLPPANGDNTRIFMRMSDLGVAMKKDRFTFDSAIIDYVKLNAVDHGGSNKLVEVEIRLKEQANYRIFSNQKGVYIEFPNVKNLQTPDKTKIAKKNAIPSENLAPLNKTLNETKDAKKKNPTPKNSKAAPKEEMAPGPQPKPPARVTFDPNDMPEKYDPSGKRRTVIKDIVLKEKDADHVKFEVIMNGHPDFNVIPIPDSPVRLAIDFKDTQSKNIKMPINFLNVKQVRGAHNNPAVYRVVFDLLYLNNYKVSTKTRNGNIVEIEFFNDSPAAKKRALAKKKTPPLQKREAPDKKKIAQNQKKQAQKKNNAKNPEKKTALNNNAAKNKNKQALKKRKQKTAMARKNQRSAQNKPTPPAKTAANPGVITAGDTRPSSITVKSDDNGINLSNVEAEQATSIKVDNRSNPGSITISNEDFFEDEKSQVTMNNKVSKQEKLKPLSSTPKRHEGMQMKFLKKTIDEGEKTFVGDKMSFNFHNADLKDVIKIIAKISDKNIVLDPGVSGRVTSQLKNVPWDQALELFLKTNKLDAIEEGNILRIGNVQDLAKEAEDRLKLKVARQLEGDLTVVTRALSFAKVGDIVPILSKQLSPRGEILQDARSNTLIISEVPSKIEVLDKLIDTLDTANPQVSIEARVVETRTNFIESLGIQWGYNFVADAAYGNQTTLKFPNSVNVTGNQFISTASPLVGPLGGYAVNLPANGATSGTLFSVGNVANTFRLDVALSAMQSKGKAKIISAPKTSTQDNMEATIMQGKMIPVQVIQNNTITVIYRPAVLELKVTPQITANGTIICTLSIDNNSADFANLVNGIPPIITQSIKTTIMVDDGGTVVIGGMYKVEKSSTRDGVPILSKLPILGNLFRSNSRRSEQKEVLIFITPRIIK